ncbi:glycerophosphodiester phosphodiesterase [Sphingomonas sp. Leaf16]|nr:glycerophosphodiester phosphodiesterase [Sphingomonas sp. Leaf16]KQN13883.1 glycerophosphodiester phosphodiesterase [Sphingomonas sp. Leaf29]KQN23857.1 glycerophosphodiester phosphodiesterase [Sphingomonas sp. Leaf32]
MIVAAMMGSAPMAEERPLTSPPIVIAHRGASGSRPEHTLAAYELAIEQGADFIEPDLVLTKDNVFVARHENEISGTTDIADHPEFATRRTTKRIDGAAITGWFTEDFTLAELRTLRAKERLPQYRPGNTAFDGQQPVPTLAEVIALAKRTTAETGRTIGIYPETKHPSYFASIGQRMEARLVAELRAAGWDRADAPVFIQSFEVNNLKALKKLTRIRLIQLMNDTDGPADHAVDSYATMATPAGLKAVAAYAWGIGPNKVLVGKDKPLVRDAHAAGLRVHPWTYRAENIFLPEAYRVPGDPATHGRIGQEIADAVDAGVDGFFTDFPLIGAQIRDKPY